MFFNPGIVESDSPALNKAIEELTKEIAALKTKDIEIQSSLNAANGSISEVKEKITVIENTKKVLGFRETN